MTTALPFGFFPNGGNEDTVQEDLAEGLFWFVLSILFAFIVVNFFVLQYLEKNNRWIRRARRLLDALSKDIQTAKESGKKITERANQAWESELITLTGVTQKLIEIEIQWEKTAGKVASEVQRCHEEFKKVEGRKFLLRYLFFFKMFIPQVGLAFGMHRAKQHEKEMMDARQVVSTLEDLRNNLRSFEDRPIVEAQNSLANPPLPRRSELFIAEGSILFFGAHAQTCFVVLQLQLQLQLLQAFMKDLQGLRLESELEKAWVEEAKEIITQAENVIDSFVQEANNSKRLLGYQFRNSIKHFSREFSHLLEIKERYGFNFIRRDSPKNPPPLPRQESIDVESLLPDIDDTNVEEEYENMFQLLRTEQTDGAISTRACCFKLLQKLASIEMIRKCTKQQLTDFIKEALKLLKRWKKVCKITVMKESCSVVGLEEDVHKLVSRLTDNSDDEHLPIISIIGMRGIGKTVLATEIYNHIKILDHFNIRCLASIPDEFTNEITLLQEVGNKILQIENSSSNTIEDWINKLKNFLSNKKCLIILNNLCSKEAWDVLKPAFQEMINGSKIVITTRSRAVAFHANPSNTSIHPLRLRTGEESWDFFTQMVDCCPEVPDNPDAIENKIRSLAKKVVARTGGLPLSILRLGYLLSGKSLTEGELTRVHERFTQGQNQTLWEKSHDAIVEDLRSETSLEKCISYLELFPKDYEIPARRLVDVWVAQGLAQTENVNWLNQQEDGRNEEITPEKVAWNYLSQLIDRNIIQMVEKKINGKVWTCRFPATLRELWLAGRGNTRPSRSWSLCESNDRQIAYHFDNNDATSSRSLQSLDNSNVLPEDSIPLSIMFFDTREGDQPSKDIRNFLYKGIKTGRLNDLLVLDLEGVFIHRLPSVVGKLKRLTYLGLRWTSLESLPSSIGQLLDLQTLDMKHTRLKKLPRSVWKLKKLRNLHLNHECRIEVMPPPNAMKNLHKLSGAFVDQKGMALMDGLHKLNNLRKFRLKFSLKPEQQYVLAQGILRLVNLQYLWLKSVNENSEPQELQLNPLRGLQSLSSLYLSGELRSPSIVSELPQSLTELTMSASKLSEKAFLHFLGALPQLKFLSFFSESYIGTELTFFEGFPKLQFLKLWNLNNLEKMDVISGAMKMLRELEIRSCTNLKETDGLTNLSALQELNLATMPETFREAIKKSFETAKDRGTVSHLPIIR